MTDLTPDQFKQPSDPDDTASFQRLAAAINQAGTGRIVLMPRIYNIYSAVPKGTMGYSPLCFFNGVSGIAIDCLGSTIIVGYQFAMGSSDVAPLFLFENCTDVRLLSPKAIQTFNIALPQTTPIPGTQLIVPAGGNDRIYVENAYLQGGQALFNCFVGSAPGLVADQAITLINPHAKGSQYGVVFAGSGNNSSVTNGYCEGCERAIFIYNVNGVRFDVVAKDCIAAEWCLITSSAAPFIQNIHGKFTVLPRTIAGPSQSDAYVYIGAQASGASLRDIDLDLYVDFAGDTQATPARAFTFGKGTREALGSLFSNVKIRGSLRNVPAGAGNICELFRPQDAPWSGESAKGIVIGPLLVEGSSLPAFYADLSAAVGIGQVKYQDIKMPGGLLESGFSANNRLSSNAVFNGALIAP